LSGLNALLAEGRLVLAGPLPAIDSPDPGPAGFQGSLVVGEFASLEAAKNWADADPYVAAGVYVAVEIYPFRKVLPAWTAARIALLETRLRAALAPERLEIIDDSAAHAGHAGAREGGHFTVRLVSALLSAKP
jgi:uncharacterized protein YciI